MGAAVTGALLAPQNSSYFSAMNCDRINDKLLVGSCSLDDRDFEELRSQGVTAILSLQAEQDEEGLEGEKQAALAAKIAFRSVPVEDYRAADLERKLSKCVTVLERFAQGWTHRLPAL